MNEREQRLEQLFHAALQAPPEQRATILHGLCGHDAALLRDVEALLRHDVEETQAAFRRPGGVTSLIMPTDVKGATGSSAATSDSALRLPADRRLDSPAAALPKRFGRYDILGVLGEGGMGVVYRARQDKPRRDVALKVIRPGLISPSILKRFEYEAHVLGRLQHPGIAQVFEAGMADAGAGPQPYFAMELIEGEPLHRFVHGAALDVADRIELMARVCDAVHHAHQKGVIHRDLKPANILVARGAVAEPKILDFGVARATDSDVQAATIRTDVGQIIGTIQYMSPEQISADSDALDTRSDVYALGVIAYELLAEQPPLDLAGRTVHEAARAICEQEPRPLGVVNRALRGDLETIVAKALEKDKARRYQSAAELAADLRRFLHDEPISARPASAMYQLRKFARRRRGLVVSAGLVFLAVLGGAVVSTVMALRAIAAEQLAHDRLALAEQRREEAERQTRVAEAVNEFLNNDVLAQASPMLEPDRDIELRTVLDRAAERIAGRFPDEPLVEAAVRHSIGMSYLELGELDSAAAHQRAALTTFESELGDDDLRTIQGLLGLGEVYWKQSRLDDAEALWQRAADAGKRVLGDRHELTLTAINDLAVILLDKGRLVEAEAALRANLAARQEALGPDHRDTLVSMNGVGSALKRQGRWDEAEPVFVECLARSRAALGDEHPDTLIVLNSLGLLYAELGRFEEAEGLCAEALEVKRRVLGPEHSGTLAAMNNMGYVHGLQKKWDECLAHYQPTYEIRERVLGPDDPDTLLSMNNLGWLYAQMGRNEEARELLVALRDAAERLHGPDDLETYYASHTLAGLYKRMENYVEAERLFAIACDGFRQALPERHYRFGHALVGHGVTLAALERYDEAEAALLEGIGILEQRIGAPDARTQDAIRQIVALYERRGRAEDANAWRARLADAAQAQAP